MKQRSMIVLSLVLTIVIMAVIGIYIRDGVGSQKQEIVQLKAALIKDRVDFTLR
ncbi:MAG: hypothetical protein WCG34_12630 [Leptolinea sp.]